MKNALVVVGAIAVVAAGTNMVLKVLLESTSINGGLGLVRGKLADAIDFVAKPVRIPTT
jgi:hypothetical protein